MRLNELVRLTNSEVLCDERCEETDLQFAFGSDLMSDVLALEKSGVLMITGLVNLQVIRTAEMADIHHILFVRNKDIPDEMIQLARQNEMTVLRCPFSMFKASGILFNSGLQPVF